jgi:hypothetical protein
MHLIDFSTGGVNEQQRQAVGERIGQPIADLHAVFVPDEWGISQVSSPSPATDLPPS